MYTNSTAAIVISLLCFASIGTLLIAQTDQSEITRKKTGQRNVAAKEDGNIELHIATNKTSFLAGERVVLDIAFKNISGEPFWFHSFIEHNEAQLNGFVVSAINSSREELPILTQGRLGGRSRGVYTLQPEQVLHDGLIVNNLVDLTKPGTYAIKVKWKYHNSERVIWSNTLNVTVVPK